MIAGKRWWIVGASEGLGRAIAKRFDAEGASLVLSARSEDRLEALAAECRDAVPVPLDVTDTDSVREAVKRAGEVDGLLYSAGYYDPMTAQDWNIDASVKMVDVNFTGALRILGAALPKLLARADARVVLIGSVAGYRGLPGAIGYGASKAAVMHLAENLRADLKKTSVTVQVVNPGFIDTRLTQKNSFKMPMMMTPEDAAARTHRAIESGRFSTSFPAPFSTLFTLSKFMPLGLFQKLF